MRLCWTWSGWLWACGGPTTSLDTGSVAPSTTSSSPLPAEAAIEVFPTHIDFGQVAPNCSVHQILEVRNVGTYPLEILSFDLNEDDDGVFQHDGETGILAAGEVWTLDTAFTPKAAQPYKGATLRIESNDVNDWKIDVSLLGQGADDEPMIETFLQNEASSVDILWVIDDDPAMADRLGDLAAQTPSLIDGYQSLGVDAHIGVIDGDNTSADRAGQLIGGFVQSSDIDADSALSDHLFAATSGSRDLAFFDTAQAALSEPLLSGANAGFRRAEVPLAVVAYVRNDDDSSQNGATFASWLDTIDDPERTSFSAISGPKSGLLPCGVLSLDPIDPAPRIATAVTQTGGQHWVMCDHDVADIVATLPFITAGLLDRWVLERPVTMVAWMYVTVDDVEIPQDSAAGWTYDEASQSVVFHGLSVPGPGTEVVVAYPAQAPCLEDTGS